MLKEKIITRGDAITATIIREKRDGKSPDQCLFSNISIYLKAASSDYYTYQIHKNPHHRASNENKDQNSDDALFKIGVLPKEMTRVKQEPLFLVLHNTLSISYPCSTVR